MMKKLLSLALGLVLSGPAFAQDSQIERIYQFLKTSVEFKKFKNDDRIVLPTGLLSVSSRTQVISGVTRSDDEMHFTFIFAMTQTLFEPNGNGGFATEGVTKDRVGTTDCVVNEKRSTKEVIGTCRVGSNSMLHSGSATDVIRLKMVDGKLMTTRLTSFYSDAFAQGGGTVPGRTRSLTDFYVNAEGKTVMEDALFAWHVNPETLEAVTAETEYPRSVVVGE